MLELEDSDCYVGLAVKSCSSKCREKCQASVDINGQNYRNVPFTVLNDLLADVVFGSGFHESVVLNLFDLLAYPRPIKKREGALCMGSQNNMLN